jgi:hypothetical protein
MTLRKATGLFLLLLGFFMVGWGDVEFFHADTMVELVRGTIIIVAGVVTFHRGIFKLRRKHEVG